VSFTGFRPCNPTIVGINPGKITHLLFLFEPATVFARVTVYASNKTLEIAAGIIYNHGREKGPVNWRRRDRPERVIPTAKLSKKKSIKEAFDAQYAK
jgi:hypothetical protein